jgi:hypothetical protein
MNAVIFLFQSYVGTPALGILLFGIHVYQAINFIMIILNWVINNFDIFSIFIIFATIIKTSSR